MNLYNILNTKLSIIEINRKQYKKTESLPFLVQTKKG